MAYQGGGNVSNNATRRMLSAGRLKINELRNKVAELTVQLANVQSENKQLMRQQRQQVTEDLPASCLLYTTSDLIVLCSHVNVAFSSRVVFHFANNCASKAAH